MEIGQFMHIIDEPPRTWVIGDYSHWCQWVATWSTRNGSVIYHYSASFRIYYCRPIIKLCVSWHRKTSNQAVQWWSIVELFYHDEAIVGFFEMTTIQCDIIRVTKGQNAPFRHLGFPISKPYYSGCGRVRMARSPWINSILVCKSLITNDGKCMFGLYSTLSHNA